MKAGPAAYVVKSECVRLRYLQAAAQTRPWDVQTHTEPSLRARRQHIPADVLIAKAPFRPCVDLTDFREGEDFTSENSDSKSNVYKRNSVPDQAGISD